MPRSVLRWTSGLPERRSRPATGNIFHRQPFLNLLANLVVNFLFLASVVTIMTTTFDFDKARDEADDKDSLTG